MWVAAPDWQGFSARSGAAALAVGLRHRPRQDLLADTLAWERRLGLGRDRRAAYSSGWWARAGGSRPARSQPKTAAASGIPMTMMSRFAAGTLDSSDRPSSGLDQE